MLSPYILISLMYGQDRIVPRFTPTKSSAARDVEIANHEEAIPSTRRSSTEEEPEDCGDSDNVASTSFSAVNTATEVTPTDVSSAAPRAEPKLGRAEECPGFREREGATPSPETNAAAGGVEAGAIDIQRLMTVRLIVILVHDDRVLC